MISTASSIKVYDYLDKKLEPNVLYDQFKQYSLDEIIYIDFGKRSYRPMWKFQKKIHELVKNQNIPNMLMFLEHDHVYTFGKNSNKDYLLNNNISKIDVVESDRGGEVTYHGPGQLIGYPIINLKYFSKSISWYMRSLEQTIIRSLNKYNISANGKDGMPGVWIEDEKICAMGVRISKWVTMHGFALNLRPDMKYFNSMIPCGIFEYGVTSMYNQLLEDISLNSMMEEIACNFNKIFKD